MAEKTLSKEEWAQVEKSMSGTFGVCTLQVDGRKVTLQRSLVSKNRLGIEVFVDGAWKGEWVGRENDCPEQRYLCRRERFLYPAARRNEMKKSIKKVGKKRWQEWGMGDPDAKFELYLPVFPNATAFRRQYQKTFQSIELIEVIG